MQEINRSPYYFPTGQWQCILYNISITLKTCLYRVQNCTTSLLTRKGEHITPVLFQLHLVPVRFRSMYRILFHTFSVLSGIAPLYLSDLIENYIPVRMLRSETNSLLIVQTKPAAMYRERSFRASAPRLWNELPNHI
jgi:hypothetical protein